MHVAGGLRPGSVCDLCEAMGDLRELLRVPLRSRDTVDLGGASRASTVFGVMEEGSRGVLHCRL